MLIQSLNQSLMTRVDTTFYPCPDAIWMSADDAELMGTPAVASHSFASFVTHR